MNKIKVVGIIVLILSISLAILSSYIRNENKINSSLLETINKQKAFTQEISKNIFYIYKNKNSSKVHLEESIKSFLENMNNRDNTLKEIPSKDIKKQSEVIVILWNKFYLDVQKFRTQSKVSSPYSSILLEKTVNNIYTINLKLIVEFNKLISIHQGYFHNILHNYRSLQYSLFLLMCLFLIYLFTQIKLIINFIQQFSKRSKDVIKNSSISELTPMEVKNSNKDLKIATENFNFLVQKINDSITYSSNSIEHTSKSLTQIETNIEEFLTLLNSMDENKEIDVQMTKKEDVVIQSLDELMNITDALNNLRSDLENLTKIKNKN